jgi:hypothetical protein
MTISDSLQPPAARDHAQPGRSAAFDKLAALVAA